MMQPSDNDRMDTERERAAQVVFRAICEEIQAEHRRLNVDLYPEFTVIGIPAWVAGDSGSFEIEQVLRLVLGGATLIDEKDPVNSRVVAMDFRSPFVKGTSIERNSCHSFVVIPLPNEAMVSALSIPRFFAYILARIGASGDKGGGTSRTIYKNCLDIIKGTGSIVRHVERDLEIDPFNHLFINRGPLVWVKFPNSLSPANYGDRFPDPRWGVDAPEPV